ncbi:MAG: branched-chain amino acid transport system II carrier protein, partial [Lysinibacillus sp.]
MEKKVSFSTYAIIGTMLFGMFFGAGNLIFPIQMGQLAGTNYWWALVG